MAAAPSTELEQIERRPGGVYTGSERGVSSVGRASALQAEGRRFEPGTLHSREPKVRRTNPKLWLESSCPPTPIAKGPQTGPFSAVVLTGRPPWYTSMPARRQAHISRVDINVNPLQAVDRATGVAGEPVLAAEGISKRFGHVRAVDGVDVALYRGELVALVGDNGAGKSTFVSILSGVIEPDAGTIRVAGRPVTLHSPRRAQELGIAAIFQDLALVNQRDVAANLYIGREPRRFGLIVDRRRMLRDATEVIARLGVGLPSVRTPAGNLSGGQRQAIAVARAVAQGGLVTLMDEPTAALGVREARKVIELILTLRNEGHALLLVSHNIESVFQIADRVVILRHGRLIANLRVAETSREEIVGLIVGAREANGR